MGTGCGGRSPEATSVRKWQVASDPDSSRLTINDSHVTPAGSGFSFRNFRGLFNIGSQYPVRPTTEPMATPPVIDWGDEDSPAASAAISSGGIKMKSSWLSKFLSATGAKQDRATAHDFEVALPKRK